MLVVARLFRRARSSRRITLVTLCLLVAALMGVALPCGAEEERGLTLEEMKSERRLALVIGNSRYASSPLKNPVNDAKRMAKTLRRLGFDVTVLTDASQREMKTAIRDFGRKLKGGVGLFYFAGHGVQIAGRNYLIPIGAKIDSEDDVDIEAVDVGAVLAKMGSARSRLNIVILDACRNNPFARSFRSGRRGLAQLNAPNGTLIAYATAPGQVAADGKGKNGTYTAALVRAMQKPAEIGPMFRKVRTDVRRKTSGAQVPWEASSIEGEFYFRLPTPPPPPKAAPVVPAPVVKPATPAPAVKPAKPAPAVGSTSGPLAHSAASAPQRPEQHAAPPRPQAPTKPIPPTAKRQHPASSESKAVRGTQGSSGSAQGADEPGLSTQATVGWAVTGVGVAGVATSGVFALLAKSADASADEFCQPDNPAQCDEQGVEYGEQAQSQANIATWVGGVGLAALVTGVVVLLTTPGETLPKSHGLNAQLGPQSAGVTWGTRW